MKHLFTREAYALFESQDIGFIALVTKYKDDFKGLVEVINANTAGEDKARVLNPTVDSTEPMYKKGTPENKAAIDTIMKPVHASVMGLIDRMAVDNKMSQGQVILSIYDKLDSGLMNAIVTIAKPFAKEAVIDQGVVDSLVQHLSADPKLSAIAIETKPAKGAPKGVNGQPVTVNGGSLIGSVINTIISKLGMARATTELVAPIPNLLTPAGTTGTTTPAVTAVPTI